MATSFKCRGHKQVDHLFGQRKRYKTRRDANDVRIVVFAHQQRYIVLPAKSGADVLVFVCSDRNTVCAAAKQYAKTAFAVFNTRCHGMRKIRVVNGVWRTGPKIFYLVPFAG